MASSRMSYSRFLEYLDMGRVKKVNGAAVLNTGLHAGQTCHIVNVSLRTHAFATPLSG